MCYKTSAFIEMYRHFVTPNQEQVKDKSWLDKNAITY